MTTRRSLLLSSLVLAGPRGPRAGTLPEPYEGHIPSMVMTDLDDRRLAAIAGKAVIYSDDVAKTWSAPVPIRQLGKELDGSPVSLMRLRSGDLAMLYQKIETLKTPSYSSPRRTLF